MVENSVASRVPSVSLVVPAYNEETRLDALSDVLAFLQGQGFGWEVLVVDDGSTDSTAQRVEELARQHYGLRLLRSPHRGKGHAVRTGMLASRGELRFFSDVDFSVPIRDLPRFIPALGQSHVAIGSREAPGAVRYHEPAYRHWMGRIYNLLVRLLLLPGIQDTQCGFKGFRREAAETLFAQQQIDDFGFDIEVLYLARLRGYRITEVPVHWTYGTRSRLRPVRDSWRMFCDLWRVRIRAWRGCYRQG